MILAHEMLREASSGRYVSRGISVDHLTEEFDKVKAQLKKTEDELRQSDLTNKMLHGDMQQLKATAQELETENKLMLEYCNEIANYGPYQTFEQWKNNQEGGVSDDRL